MKTIEQTQLSQANAAFRIKDYERAILFYDEALKYASEPLTREIQFNRKLASRRLDNSLDTLQDHHLLNNIVDPIYRIFQNLPFDQSSEVLPRFTADYFNSPFYNWESPLPSSQLVREVNSNYEKRLQSFGASLLGPVLAVFFSKLANKLIANNGIKKLWFLAREGYFLQKAFKRITKTLGLEYINTDYLYCSRTLLFRLSLFDRNVQYKSLHHGYTGSLECLFRKRYAFTSDEMAALFVFSQLYRSNASINIVLPRDESLVLKILKEAEPFLREQFDQRLGYYKNYLNAVGFGVNNIEHVVDLGYSGTIQTLLTDLTNTATNGHYFITTKKAVNTFNLQFNGYLGSNVDFGEGNSLLDRSLFMESMLTAPHGQVIDICKSVDGKLGFFFGLSTTAQKRFDELEMIIDGAINYAACALEQGVVMNLKELENFYANFVSSPSLFPEPILELFEIDDNISGFGVLNPITFFRGRG
jgi:hypothetical protein